MKLLLLAFAIISFLAQTTQGIWSFRRGQYLPGGWGKKKCYNNAGLCQNQCKSNEKEFSTCANKKKCCVPTDKLPKDSAGKPASGGSTVAPPGVGALTPPSGTGPAGAPGTPPAAGATPGAAAGPDATPAPGAKTDAPAAAATTTAAPTEAATTTAAPGGE